MSEVSEVSFIQSVPHQRFHCILISCYKALLFVYNQLIPFPRLLPVATAHGIIPLLCDWLTHVSSPLSPPPPPPHTLVILVVGMLVGVAKIPHCQQEVSQGLPLNQLHTLLLKESTTSRVRDGLNWDGII